MKREIIPKVKQSIGDFLFDEEGNITRNKVLTFGSMMLIMGIVMSIDALAAHSSHKSHSSHSSHSSGSSGSSNHYSHTSHTSHTSHVSSSTGSHSSHTSSSTGSHASGSTHASASTGTHSNVTVTEPAHTNIMPSMSGIALKTPPATESLGLDSNIAVQIVLPDTPKIK